MNPRVSIVMSFYNEDIKHLKEAINSILYQTYINFELIIISDNPDNLQALKFVREIQCKDNRVHLVENSCNKGLVFCLNTGIGISSGEYIVRMDADDISELNRIEEQVKYMDGNNEIVLAGSEIEVIDENNNKIVTKIKKRGKNADNLERLLKYGNIFVHPSIIFRKKAIENIGLYRNVPYAEDYDLIVRLIRKNNRVMIMNEKLLKYRIRNNGISRSNNINQIISTEYIKYLYNKNKLNEYDYEYLQSILTSKLNWMQRVQFLTNKVILIFYTKLLK